MKKWKAVVGLVSFFSGGVVIAAEKPISKIECILVELHDGGVFEESFSGVEYPHIDLEKLPGDEGYALSIGSSGFYTSDGDKITESHDEIENDDGDYTYTQTVEWETEYGSKYTIEAQAYWRERSATLNEISDDGEKSKVADLACWGSYLTY